jgi:TetR/AcrR family transcriptional regulator, mexJK operon transcriptional repressor
MSRVSGSSVTDPRVKRSRSAAVEAATTLFLEHGYAGTTMDDVAERAGLTKRTLYNNFGTKAALFMAAVADTMAFAEQFAAELDEAYFEEVATDPPAALDELARRLALSILRPPVISLRRLLISEAGAFPHLAQEYYERAPGGVLRALAAGFQQLTDARYLACDDARRAAEQFAYLVVGAPLDRAMLLGTVPPRQEVVAGAEAGVTTFLARYGAGPRRRRRSTG